MYPNYSKTFLDLEDVLIRKVTQADSFLQIHIETLAAEQTCPCCNKKTKRVHDYRFQKIQDIPNLGKHVTLILRKRRYLCTSCGKRFWNTTLSCHLIAAEPKDWRITLLTF